MSEYEDIMQYYYLVLCNRLIEKYRKYRKKFWSRDFWQKQIIS